MVGAVILPSTAVPWGQAVPYRGGPGQQRLPVPVNQPVTHDEEEEEVEQGLEAGKEDVPNLLSLEAEQQDALLLGQVTGEGIAQPMFSNSG